MDVANATAGLQIPRGLGEFAPAQASWCRGWREGRMKEGRGDFAQGMVESRSGPGGEWNQQQFTLCLNPAPGTSSLRGLLGFAPAILLAQI